MIASEASHAMTLPSVIFTFGGLPGSTAASGSPGPAAAVDTGAWPEGVSVSLGFRIPPSGVRDGDAVNETEPIRSTMVVTAVAGAVVLVDSSVARRPQPCHISKPRCSGG